MLQDEILDKNTKPSRKITKDLTAEGIGRKE
jgi:hypothetical protein